MDRIIKLGSLTILEVKIKIGVNRKPFTRIYFLDTKTAEEINTFIDNNLYTEYFKILEGIKKKFSISSMNLFQYYKHWQLS